MSKQGLVELVFKGEVGVGSHCSKLMGQLPWCAVGYAREAIGRGERGGPILETVLGPPLLLCAKHVCSHMNVKAPTDQNNQSADQKKLGTVLSNQIVLNVSITALCLSCFF